MIDLRGGGNVPGAHEATSIDAKLAGVRARVRDLAVLESELEGLVERCQRLDPADCTDADICHLPSAPRAQAAERSARP